MAAGAYYGKTDTEEVYKTFTYAADRGVTFWDTADCYGDSEIQIGNWLKDTGRRSEITLATKFGYQNEEIGDRKPCSKPSYIRRAVERSLKNLQTNYIDIYYQHRVDKEVPIEVVMKTLGELVNEGKIKYIGLSECSPATLRRAKAVPGAGDKLVVVQMEYSLFTLDVEREEFAQALKDTGVGLVAYSPLNRGLASGRFRSRADFDKDDARLILPRFSEENFPKVIAIVDKLQEIGKRTGLTSSQVALSWIVAEHDNFVPIPGCRNAARLEENAGSGEVKLSADDVNAIRELAKEADQTVGPRYPVVYIPEGDCIALAEWKGE
ncbi:hypothetical protein M422DRAFT_37941 [Sphaerobolus stellatus SS14]|uniref:NADP-dependent oxidoreductase domain-containing protein n=1 Tax=Sphaerobolus stellatus (strain SS14) TaxID=990650 RepID=A0A0C9UD67_SPHS4|nr:hypothetical protein M422DRAFT_37941 [Sphaerobolus stellatus SS14]